MEDQQMAEKDTFREGVEAVIRDRYAGDFAPILPKLQALLDEEGSRG